MKSYLDRSEECHRQIIGVLSNLQSNLNGKANRVEIEKPIDNPWKELAEITASLPDKLKKSILQEAIHRWPSCPHRAGTFLPAQCIRQSS